MSPLPTRRSTTRTTNKLGARTLPMERSDDAWDAHDDGQEDETLPRRPRRQFFNRGTASLAALITCAAGFYAGIRIEKGQLASSSSALSTTGTGTGASASRRAAFAALFSGGSGATGSTGSTSATGATRSTGTSGTAAATGGFGGFGAAAGGGTVGTVAVVNGKTLDVTETSGNTVKVKLSSATKVSKTETVGRSAVRPGDSVVITGVTGSGGTVSAAAVTDSGNHSTASSTTSSSSGSSSSGVSSLFSAGG
jgi:hypothetical protein